jgi:hypothetical protein
MRERHCSDVPALLVKQGMLAYKRHKADGTPAADHA